MLVILLPLLLLQGCWFQSSPENVVTDPEVPLEENAPVNEPPAIPTPSQPGRFTLRYDSHSSLNPITTLNRDNILLSSLLYESLFVLDGNLKPKALLCESWSSTDNLTFTFKIKPDIAVCDGSWLGADDVAYSLKQAMLKGRYINRFKSVSSITSDGDLTVTIVLFAPNSRFINLLDIPIIKSGTIDNRNPPGTGPYILVVPEPKVVQVIEDEEEKAPPDEDESEEETETELEPEPEPEPDPVRLERFPRYRDYLSLPVSTIYLLECDDSELTELFDDGELSLLWDDPSDAFDIRINRLPEKRFYTTSAMQFIGFNARKGIMANPDVRRAIGCSLDRQFIVDNIMAGHQAEASPLALPPSFWLYDKEWEHRDLDPLLEMTLLFLRAGLEDVNDDSYLELYNGVDGYVSISLDFIVNIENAYRTQAAHKIADTLRRTGVNINVRELSWEDFTNALKAGRFDMYYGEIMLSADYDLSPLLLPGSELNYGGTVSSEYRPYIDDFLTARDDDEVIYAAKRLCDYITLYAPFVPILYKKHAIYYTMGAISGAAPSQSGVFYDFGNWTIDMMMLS